MRASAATCLGVIGFAACFSPAPQAGAPCGDNGTCPATLECSPATNTCEDPDNAVVPDAMPDTMPDAGFCFGTGLVTGCLPAAPTEALDINDNTAITLDTGDDANCTIVLGDDPGICVVAASTVTIDGVLRALGTRPLAVVSASTITIAGLLDVATRNAVMALGAGANPASCVAGTPAVLHAGGGGGSFGGRGGNGHLGIDPGSGGVAAEAVTSVTSLRGGCPGDDGIAVAVGQAAGDGAAGGGAVYVIALQSIAVAGQINASGGGGGGCDNNCGGGGGGSGGMIGLDAPTITIAEGGEAFANGGGGGEGSQANASRVGGEPTTAGTPAPGGTAGSCAGDGGVGAQGTTLVGGDGLVFTCTGAGGGGGGGGAGVIKIHGTATVDGLLSPPAT